MTDTVRSGTGLLHLYTGDGKGKTTAGMGLCIRAAGAGYRVLICQFMKDNSSNERKAMRYIPGISFMEGPERVTFSFQMTEQEKHEQSARNNRLLQDTFRKAENEAYDVLFLDEAVYAVNAGLLDENLLLACLKNRPDSLEVILTGRNPGEELCRICDYHSQIQKIRHPFDKKQPARKGIEK